MKRNIVIATVAAATLIGGGSALAFAGTDDGAETRAEPRTQAQGGTHRITVKDDDRDDRADQDDRDDRGGTDDRDDRAGQANPARADAGIGGVKLTAAQAVEAALKSQSGTAVAAELDDEDDAGDDSRERPVWEVDVLGRGNAWHTLHVDAATGRILGMDDEDDADGEDDARAARAALKDAKTTAAQAAEAAAAKGFVTSVDLDDDGRAGQVSEGWEIETVDSKGTERDWSVDVRTGKLTVDHDDRNSDDHDDRDDD